jgi:hypothetical protein
MQMIHTLFHPLRILWNERVTLFWPIWLALTLAGMFFVSFFLGGGDIGHSKDRKKPQKGGSRVDAFALVALSAIVILFIAGSFVWEDFTYYDNSHFTNETLQGRSVTIQVSSAAGRFWPFGYQEFNLARHVTNSISGYHAIRVAELLAMCGVLLVLDKELRLGERTALTLLLLVTPSIVIIFSGLIYSEANVITGFVCLLWCISRFQDTGHKRWAVAAVLFAQIVLYYKETAFILVGGLAIGDMIYRCVGQGASGWRVPNFRDRMIRLDMLLTGLVVIFLLYYRAAMYPIFGMGYGNESKLPLTQVILSDFRIDILAWIFIVVAVVRMVLIFRGRAQVWPLWDGLALAGLTTFAAYLYLQMASGYYLAPVDLIAVLYVGRLGCLVRDRVGYAVRWTAAGLAVLVIVQDVSLSIFRVYEAKNTIHGKAQEARAIASLYRAHPEEVKELFFPYANAFDILEFGAYLNYLGLPIEQEGPAARSGGIELAGRSILKEGPCGYRTFVCHPENDPQTGQLVVILPDDPKRLDGLFPPAARESTPLITYVPGPPIPGWMGTYVAPLHVISPEFAFTGLPPGWLDGSVTLWR